MSKLIIADSGSTKTDWRIINTLTNSVEQLTCKGLNPFHNTNDQIVNELNSTFTSIDTSDIDDIYFYGAGCSSVEKQHTLNGVLSSIFPNANISVAHDLLAAARATLNKQIGIVLILGTGSSCGFYDGVNLTMPIPSLGYILGDEGSGVSLGKSLLTKYFYGKFPQELAISFNKRYLLDKEVMLDHIYKGNLPNKYIASFSQFAFHNKHHPFIAGLIQDTFRELFENVISSIPNFQKYQISIVGSIGFYYSDFIRSVANDYGVRLGVIIEKPIAGLTIYHTNLED